MFKAPFLAEMAVILRLLSAAPVMGMRKKKSERSKVRDVVKWLNSVLSDTMMQPVNISQLQIIEVNYLMSMFREPSLPGDLYIILLTSYLQHSLSYHMLLILYILWARTALHDDSRHLLLKWSNIENLLLDIVVCNLSSCLFSIYFKCSSPSSTESSQPDTSHNF